MNNTRRKSINPDENPLTPAATDKSPADELGLLSAKQRAVVVALCGDGNLAQAAKSVGIDRQTVYNWLHRDPRFKAALNLWQQQTAADARNRLMALSTDAVATIGEAIRGGDAKTALELLRRLTLLAPVTNGPTEPAGVIRESAVERRERDAEYERREQRIDDDEKMQRMFKLLETKM